MSASSYKNTFSTVNGDLLTEISARSGEMISETLPFRNSVFDPTPPGGIQTQKCRDGLLVFRKVEMNFYRQCYKRYRCFCNFLQTRLQK